MTYFTHQSRTTHEKLKIMLLEDKVLIRRQTTGWLQKAGYEVSISTGDDSEALLAFQQNPTDIAVLDIKIHNREMAGVDLAKKLKKIKKDLPIIFISAYPEENFGVAREVNPAVYVTKPYNAISLLNHIKLFAYKAYGDGEVVRYPNVHFHSKKLCIRLRIGGRFFDLLHENILYLKGDGNNTKIFIKGDQNIPASHPIRSIYISGVKIKHFQQELPKYPFQRFHRSFIAARAAIEDMKKTSLTIKGKVFNIGRSYQKEVRQWWEEK